MMFINPLIHLLAKLRYHFASTCNYLMLSPTKLTSSSSKMCIANNECNSCNNVGDEDYLSANHAKLVMDKLGLFNTSELELSSIDKNCTLMSTAYKLLEEKEASMQELKEAFDVFDENGDGFISANELHNVMQKLGFKEGILFNNCKRMIKAYDEDDDGEISFHEFKNMLEDAQ